MTHRPFPGRRQSHIDFHSFRRWFVCKAVDALEKGAKGFTPWTIAEVIGHAVETRAWRVRSCRWGLP